MRDRQAQSPGGRRRVQSPQPGLARQVGTDRWPLARSQVKKKPQRKQTWNLIPAHRPADSMMGAGASSRSEMSELFSVYTKVHSTDIYSFVQNKINVICHHKNLYSREETCSRGRSWGPH